MIAYNRGLVEREAAGEKGFRGGPRGEKIARADLRLGVAESGKEA